MNDIIRVRRRPRCVAARTLAAVIATTGLGLLAAACSGSPSSTGTSSPTNAGGSANSQLLAFAQCVRSRGVPNFPDPNSLGEFNKATLHQLAASNPKYEAATQACAHLMPGGNGMTPAEAQEVASDELKFVRCMRSHGVPNWPSPTLDRGRLVFNPQAAGIDPNSPQVSGKMLECDHVFPASLGVPPGAGHNTSHNP